MTTEENHADSQPTERHPSGQTFELTMRFASQWEEIVRVNDAVTEFLERRRLPPEQNQRCTMIACELVENAIKYGCYGETETVVLLHVQVSSRSVLVQVRNPVCDDYRSYLEELDRTIQWTRGFQDPFEAYIERVKAISSEPLGMKRSCLGIARIAYEGGAALDFYLDEDGTVSVAALASAS